MQVAFSTKKLIYLLLVPFFYFILRVYLQRASAFGCFDDCFNYVAAYFMLKGRILYSEIFFNHQPFAAYLSFLVQKFTHPRTIWELLLFHRLTLFAFSLFFDLLIVFRFRLIGLGFILFYELSKFYLFGDRFLAESFIVYPLVYMFGLLWLKYEGKRFFASEYILISVFTWFIIFSREPYILAALFLYLSLLWEKRLDKRQLFSFSIFLFLSLFTILTLPLKDYYFNVFQVNAQTVVSAEVEKNLFTNGGIFRSFGYPLLLFFDGKWNIFRLYLVSLDVVFLILLLLTIVRIRKMKLVWIILFLLGLANLRVIAPGTIFYEAFHMIEWYGLFVASIFLLLGSLSRQDKDLAYVLTFFLLSSLAFLMFTPSSYLWDKVNRQEEFVTSYADYLSNGEVIKLLADPDDTLFLDNRQDLVYWQANLNPAYKYSWYTWMMPDFPVYNEARLEMFSKSPPDFYYGYCPSGTTSAQTLPKERISDYAQLYFADRPSCLYLRKEKVGQIPKERWDKIKRFEYYLP